MAGTAGQTVLLHDPGYSVGLFLILGSRHTHLRTAHTMDLPSTTGCPRFLPDLVSVHHSALLQQMYFLGFSLK